MLFCDSANESFDKFDHNKKLVNKPSIYSFLLSCNQDLSTMMLTFAQYLIDTRTVGITVDLMDQINDQN
jgi:hypothetical protein